MKNMTPEQTQIAPTSFDKAGASTDATARKVSFGTVAPATRTLKRKETEMQAEDNYETLTGRFATTLATVAILCGALFLFAATARASTYVVTNTNNSGPGSLREKITAANADPFSTINFNIPGAGVHTIVVTTPLPAITQPVTIDAYSQPGASPNTQVNGSNALLLIELNGSAAFPFNQRGLQIDANDCVIRGLVINHFEFGIINGPGGRKTTVTGCFIGTNAAGNAAAPNEFGIVMPGSSDNIIGGASLSSRNLISGNKQDGIFIGSGPSVVNAKNNLVAGNLIGLDKSGTGAIPNRQGIRLESVAGPNTIGGASPLARNVISGNQIAGISLYDADETLVIGNYIGTNAAGTAKVGNAYGITLNDLSTNNKIGDIGSGNLISGNTNDGIRFGQGAINNCPFNNQVIGNLIGTMPDGANALSNAEAGIYLGGNATINNIIGGPASPSGNVIAFNSVGIASTAGTGNLIQQNSIFSNKDLGIDLIGIIGPDSNDPNDADTGPNSLQNAPLLDAAYNSGGQTIINGWLYSADNKSYRIEFFANAQCSASGRGEGETYLGQMNVTQTGDRANFAISFALVSAGKFITTTATDPNGNTSEFSGCKQVAAAPPGIFVFSAPTYTVNENGGTATVSVSRIGGSTGAVHVLYMTGTGGTATPNADYTIVDMRMDWNDGDASTKTFPIPIIDDTLDEQDETINLSLSDPIGGATLGNQSTAILTISDDDSQPGLSISEVSVAEGNSGTTAFNFNVTLSAASSQTLMVDFATAGGTATSGADFQPANNTLTFNPGETSKAITVMVNGDTTNEPDEAFVVNLSNPSNATLAKAQGTGTIINDDAPGGPTLQFSQANYSVAEGLSAMTLTVTRSGDPSGAASVDYTTSDGSATQKGDFGLAAGTLQFAAGEVSQIITVLFNQDIYSEGPESFSLVLSNPAGAALGAQTVALVSINDDLPEGLTSPIDNAESFVYTHYHDFLNREPDAAGLAFWTNQIMSCGNDAKCIEERRINVSAAFFLSIEFQETGYLRYLLQRESFASSPKYAEFMRDVQELSRGVIVNSPGWEKKLQTNQQQFAKNWVNRPAFKAAYDAMSNADFVNALYANAGILPSQVKRDSLVNALDTASESRSALLLEVAADAAFRQKENSAAFVMMQYFGYLRRDPASAPDSDLSGYNFWLTKLNQFGGNYIDAEMIKAFITSFEYRQRFGQ